MTMGVWPRFRARTSRKWWKESSMRAARWSMGAAAAGVPPEFRGIGRFSHVPLGASPHGGRGGHVKLRPLADKSYGENQLWRVVGYGSDGGRHLVHNHALGNELCAADDL